MQKTLSTGTRIGSMILDHLLMTMICLLFSIPLFIRQITSVFTISHEMPESGINGPWMYLAALGFSLYFCKDCINGRSPAKRITRLQVVDHRTGQVASTFRYFIRDLFIILWPVEVIMTLINPARRLGDYIAGTRVVVYDPSIVVQPGINIRSLILPVVLSYGLLLLLLLPMQQLMSDLSREKYVRSSYNAVESQSLEKMYADHLGQRLTASVRVYDKTETGNKKYISLIFRLKPNELDAAGQLEDSTQKLLYTRHPKETITGNARYVWQSNGSMRIQTMVIGTPSSE